MALGGSGLFCLEAGAGTALLLLFFPTGMLGKGFFALHGALACAFFLFAALAEPPGLPTAAAAAATALAGLYTLPAHAARARRSRPLLPASPAPGLCGPARVPLVPPRGTRDSCT